MVNNLVTRSHFETFLLLRNKALKKRNFNKYVDEDEERVNLITGVENDINDENQLNIPPPWIEMISDFRFEANRVDSKIDQLKELQETYLRITMKSTSIFENESDIQENNEKHKEIETKTSEISKLLTHLHSLLMEMKALKSVYNKSRVIENLLRYECKHISDVTSKFRSIQRDYLNQLNHREKLSQQYIINIEDNYNNLYTDDADQINTNTFDDEIVIFKQQNIQSSQQQQMITSEDDIRVVMMRDKDMSSILKSINELNEIFHEVNTNIINQGSVLDQIDYNIENVQNRVEEGLKHLQSADQKLQRSRKMKGIFLIIVSLLIFLIIFISTS